MSTQARGGACGESARLLGIGPILRSSAGAPHPGPNLVVGCKLLRRNAENFFELTTEVSFCRETYLRRCSFAGVTPRNELPGQTTLELTQPFTWRTMKVFVKNALHVAFGY